jgi:hypothetical protein
MFACMKHQHYLLSKVFLYCNTTFERPMLVAGLKSHKAHFTGTLPTAVVALPSNLDVVHLEENAELDGAMGNVEQVGWPLLSPNHSLSLGLVRVGA